MSTSDDDDSVPSVEVCDHLCKEFVEITNSDSAMAHFQLHSAQWNLEAALNQYFASNPNSSGTGAASAQRSASPCVTDTSTSSARADASAATPSSTTATDSKTSSTSKNDGNQPKVLKLMTWNIDGLDKNGISIRTKAVCTIVLKEKPTVVFLQEVVNDSVSILAEYLGDEYWVLKGKQPRSAAPAPPYFTAMLLKRDDVELDREPELIPFSTSIMDRSLLKIEVEIFGVPCILMTSHLESTKECAQERMKQLRICFDVLEQKVPDNVTAFFGGDLNLRDTELDQVGGIPPGVNDLWVACGSAKDCLYTWDCMKNDNLNSFDGAKFKPRSRFDRLYVKHPTVDTGPVWKPTQFSLVGTQRILKYGRFASDHWGIVCHLVKL